MSIERTGSVQPTNYTICTSSTHPANPVQGALIYETDTNELFAYDGSAWQPVGQPARAWTFISEVNLGSDGAISFTSIPATFTHLELLVDLRSNWTSTGAVSDGVGIKINNDGTAADYGGEQLNVTLSSVSGGAAGTGSYGVNIFNAASTNDTANRYSSGRLLIPNYQSSHNKSFSGHCGGAAYGFLAMGWGQWASTAVINRVDLVTVNGTAFKAGSRATLLGIR